MSNTCIKFNAKEKKACYKRTQYAKCRCIVGWGGGALVGVYMSEPHFCRLAAFVIKDSHRNDDMSERLTKIAVAHCSCSILSHIYTQRFTESLLK